MANSQAWEICRETVTVTQSMSSTFWNVKCVEKETFLGKTKGDNTKGFKSRMNQHISVCKKEDSTCKFPRHV